MARVLFALTYYHPHWTGLTQYAKRVAEGLAQRGHKVKVITTKHGDKLPTSETIGGVEIKREPVWFRLSRTLVSPVLMLDSVRAIANADKIIVFLPFAEILWINLWAKIFGKQVYLVHNGDLKLPDGLINRALEKIYDWSTEIAIDASEAIVIHTKDYAENSRVLARHVNKWRVILPPIEPMRPDKKLIKKKVGENIIGFAGRFVEEKGFDILIKSIPLILAKRPKTRFAFAGETQISYENFFDKVRGEYNKYKRNITSLGLLTLEQMASFYKACDVFVVSSRSDCFPVTQVEAMFCGTPVVVTDIPGARWPVTHTGMGVIVKSEDPQSLAEGVIHVLDNRKKYIRKKTDIAKVFNYEKSIEEYEKLISGN